MTHYAYCDRTGTIEFGETVPDGRLPIAKHDDRAQLEEKVGVVARLAYDNVTLLVPGIPEADDDESALEALEDMVEQVKKRLGPSADPRTYWEREADDDSYPPPCSDPGGHAWPQVEESERCLCIHCGADGDA